MPVATFGKFMFNFIMSVILYFLRELIPAEHQVAPSRRHLMFRIIFCLYTHFDRPCRIPIGVPC